MALADEIVLVAVKCTVVACDRLTGQRLWQQTLASSMSGDFVTVVADGTRVYAHTRGKLYCLDLQTGRTLWEDGLSGLGYGIASMALPNGPSSGVPPMARRQADDTAAQSSS